MELSNPICRSYRELSWTEARTLQRVKRETVGLFEAETRVGECAILQPSFCIDHRRFCGRGGKYSIDLFSVCIISSDFG